MQAGSPARADRRLAAILAADVVGYSRLMEADEAGTARALREHRAAAVPLIVEHGGRIVKTTGDGVLIEFRSVVGAVQCGVAIQKLMSVRNAEVPSERRMEWRVGIHLGDILIDGDDLIGDGVNLAARLEGIAEPGGICISEDAFRQVRGKVDTEFYDGGERALKNITRPIRIYRAQLATTPVSSVSAAPTLPLPEKPSIAVLPFQNLSGDPEQEYFVDGMVEEIITALSRIRWLFVVAGNSSFSYKGQSPAARQVGRELGVRYVLEGSVRKAGNRIRITGQLIEAETGAHLWADRFDGSFEDVFDLQDKVASSVAGVIEPALQAAETARSAGRPTEDLTAYDLYLRAYALDLTSAAQIPEELRLLEQAIDRDPRYGPALAYAAICCLRLLIYDRSEHREADAVKGVDFARRALEVAGDDPRYPGQRRPRTRLFRRGYWCRDSIGRTRTIVQPEFRTRLVHQRCAQNLGGSARYRDRAYRDRTTPQPPRPRRNGTLFNRPGAFPQSPFRGGCAEVAPRDPRRPEFSFGVSLSRGLLRAYGPL